jgi:hypothetical protein
MIEARFNQLGQLKSAPMHSNDMLFKKINTPTSGKIIIIIIYLPACKALCRYDYFFFL